VRPLGNLLWEAGGASATGGGRAGLGDLGALPDEVVAAIVASAAGVDGGGDAAGPVGPATAAAMSCASRALRAFAAAPDVWRALTLQAFGRVDGPSPLVWDRDWAGTYRASRRLAAYAASDEDGRAADEVEVEDKGAAAAPPNAPTHTPRPALYSDLLYAPWACVTSDYGPWLATDTLPRLDGAALTPDAWAAGWDGPGRPCILTGVVPAWPAFRAWSRAGLLARLDGGGEERPRQPVHVVHVGGWGMRYSAFMSIADGCVAAGDDAPLTVFDSRILGRAGLDAEYSPPACLGPDLFEALAPESAGGGGGAGSGEGAARPDWRWLIVGPRGSGSTFHKDPNGTSAWNAVIRGAKKWVLYPPGVTPPGVHPSADGATVAAPASVLEWFRSFYDPAASTSGPPGRRPVEGIARAGEVVFVPRGWWHCVLNLGEADVGRAAVGRRGGGGGDGQAGGEGALPSASPPAAAAASSDPGDETVAITHNFASAAGLAAVLRVLGTRDPALVSGLEPDAARASLGDRLEAALAGRAPGALRAARAALGRDPETGERVRSVVGDLLVGEDGGGGFKFDFGAAGGGEGRVRERVKT